MSKDRYGCSLSSECQEVVEAVNFFSDELLCAGKNLESIRQSVEKYPQEFILHIYAAIFYLYAQTIENQEKAKEHLKLASLLAKRGNERERSLYTWAHSWCKLQLSETLKHIERHCFKWPQDLPALKIAEFLFYCKGQKYESKRFLRLTTHCYHLHQHHSSFLAIHAFALELNAQYEESRQVVQRALQLNEKNPWVHHVLAHYYLNKGEIEEGIEVLGPYSFLWNQFNRGIESHNFCLLAHLYLDNLDFEKIGEIYQRADWIHRSHLVSEEIDACALLWRLELEGLDQAPLWKKLADAIGDHANFAGMPFLSAQLCYALKQGKREKALQEALTSIDHFVYTQVKEDRAVWKEVGLPLIFGSLAYTEKDYEQVLHYFDPLISKIDCAGGSDIQINLFSQTYLKSLMGAHRYWDAENFIHQKTQGRNLTKLEHKQLAECQKMTTPHL